MIEITEEDWVLWKTNSVTQFVVQALKDTRDDLKEGIAEGHSENLHQDIGRTMALKDALVFMLEDVFKNEPQEPSKDDN